MKSWAKLAIVVLLAAAGTQLLLRGQPRHSAEAGGRAPPLALADLAGKSVDLASLRGKVVAVNFWATWCPPCQFEIPDISEVWRENRDRCFEVLGVAEESAVEDVRKMSPGIPYPLLVDERGTLLGPWRVQGYPNTFLVDAEGNVRQVFEGAVRKRQLEEAIRPLLPATCPSRS